MLPAAAAPVGIDIASATINTRTTGREERAAATPAAHSITTITTSSRTRRALDPTPPRRGRISISIVWIERGRTATTQQRQQPITSTRALSSLPTGVAIDEQQQW